MDLFFATSTTDFALNIVKEDNTRLQKENRRLQEKIQLLTSEQRLVVASNIEQKVRAFKVEDERDQLLEDVRSLRQKYEREKEGTTANGSATKSSPTKLVALEKALAEAYEMIEKLEFEMETIGLLEIENQRLHSELATLRRKYDESPQQLEAEPSLRLSYDELDSGFGSQRSTLEAARTSCTRSVQLRNENGPLADCFPQRRLGMHLRSERFSRCSTETS